MEVGEGARWWREEIADLNPEALLADGFEDAVIGYSLNQHHAQVVVYDYEKCVRILMGSHGMSDEDAREYLCFNTLSAYVGEHGPLFVATRTA
jgi:hypothetical protein